MPGRRRDIPLASCLGSWPRSSISRSPSERSCSPTSGSGRSRSSCGPARSDGRTRGRSRLGGAWWILLVVYLTFSWTASGRTIGAQVMGLRVTDPQRREVARPSSAPAGGRLRGIPRRAGVVCHRPPQPGPPRPPRRLTGHLRLDPDQRLTPREARGQARDGSGRITRSTCSPSRPRAGRRRSCNDSGP